jgi:GNAT superfamily N-acetyltransferase
MKVIKVDSNSPWPEDINPSQLSLMLHLWLKPFEDAADSIYKALIYAASPNPGGGIFLLKENESYTGVAVVNRTGMSGYIPDNIIVYLAVLPRLRKGGRGTRLLMEAIRSFEGAFKLHVERENPAKGLYERIGFIHRYDELRLER